VIIGGDGTLNELINGILQRKQKECGVDLNDQTAVLKPIDIPLAIIPTGKHVFMA
jgi:diacylglycerol kinase family enzyme